MHHTTDIDWLAQACERTGSLGELSKVAIDELHKFEGGAEIVCGPISTGGRGTRAENLFVFRATINALRVFNRPIFNQMPYEKRILFFRNRWLESDPSNAKNYCAPILEEFYFPIFETGRITTAWFIPGSDSSVGASRERVKLTELDVRINDLTPDWIASVLEDAA